MKKTLQLSMMGMYAAISIIAIACIRIVLIPIAPFLVYDMADIPILLATLTLGGGSGGVVLLGVCLIQAFLMGGDGWVGCLMHLCATGAMVLIFTLITRKSQSVKAYIVAAVLATLAMTLVMIPMNLIFTVYFLGQPREMVLNMLLPAIIPFNLLKAGLNSGLTVMVYKLLAPHIGRLLHRKT